MQVGKKGERTIIDDKLLVNDSATLCTHSSARPAVPESFLADIGNCEDCDFIVTGACTKILVGAPLSSPYRDEFALIYSIRVLQEVPHHTERSHRN